MSRFLTELAKTLRPRTLNTIKWLASAIFVHAVKAGYCESNPIRDAGVLGKTLGDGDAPVYSLEEMEAINSALTEHPMCQLIMAMCFFGGMRQGEIATLKWDDISDGSIHVRRALSRGEVGEPKSKRAIRSIPIVEQVAIPLAIWRSKKPGDEGWVFPSERNTPLNLACWPRKPSDRLLTWRAALGRDTTLAGVG